MGGSSAVRFSGGADLDQRSADRAPHRALDEGQPLVVDEHCPRQHADRRAVVEPMFDRERRLRLGWSSSSGGFSQRDQVAAGLVGADPVPGLALGDVVLADVEQFFVAFADLALRTVEHHPNTVLAIEKLNVVKDITLRTIRLGKAEQLAVAIDLRFPAGRQVALDAGPVECCAGGQRPIGDDRAAAG